MTITGHRRFLFPRRDAGTELGEMPDETTTTNPTNTPAASETPASFEAWLGEQPEPIKALYNTHVSGLQNTVKATREERDAIRKQLQDVLPKAEKGSELEKSLTEINGRLEAAERRAAFAEEAVKPEIGCRNIKAAYALALADNLFARNGSPDWNAIKAAAPELFGAGTVNGNAGAGTGTTPPKGNMNDYIRHAAGRR